MEEKELPEAIRLAYFLRIANVGDRCSPMIVTAITGRPTCLVADRASPHLLACGSIMASATPSSLVWGTGVMHPRCGIGGAQRDNIFAVRGTRSLAELHRAGNAPHGVVLGDTGILAPMLLGITKAKQPTYELGLVAHYVDRWHSSVRRLLATPGVADLNVHLDPREFLALMAQCRAIASSSLHGLVFAEALGLPSVWFTATGDVAGDGFKFADWFSTTRRPQVHARRLRFWDTARALVRMAELRESTIDTQALLRAFPHHRCDELLSRQRRRISVSAGRSAPLPVFLISYNRGPMLQQAIAGLAHLTLRTDVIIHDNGSTDIETLDILSDLERRGLRVVRRAAITHADQLNAVDATVQQYFSAWCEPSRYAVSDCDVDLSTTSPDALELYGELLDKFRHAECVGPMLRIWDIPRSYPLYNRVMNVHVRFVWGRRPSWTVTSRGRVAYQACPIDTTFALHRAGEAFRRLKSALRVYEPYEARHLDWYGDASQDVYHQSSHAAISHWNNREQRASLADEPLLCSRMFVVRKLPNGRLRAFRERIRPGGHGVTETVIRSPDR